MNYYVFKNGKQEGPYEERTLRDQLENGVYLETDLAFRDGMSAWRPLAEVLNSSTLPPEPPPIPASPKAVLQVPALPRTSVTLPDPAQLVVVTDIRMPFGSMVIFILKWTLAAIPAMLILGTIVAMAWGFLFALAAGLSSHMR
ncbi:MAG: domain 2 [Chthoniobacter sp.]|jgi:hypothetical protein|nr:domain 2 [Chthoniobacter sp.]